MASPKRVLVIGATGAQGKPVVRALAQDKSYTVRVLTRNPSSARAKELEALGNVELVQGTFTSEADLTRAFDGCWGAFVNIDGFNVGEKAEMFWAIRTYELAIEAGLSFFVYANLESAYVQSGYDKQFRAGHLDGKGRIAEYIKLQDSLRKPGEMRAAVFSTGPYIEMAVSAGTIMTPKIEADGVVTWYLPLGKGAVVYVSVEECGYYAHWLFEHHRQAAGTNLAVAIDHVTGDELAAAFTRATGKPARYVDVPFDTYFASGGFAGRADSPAAYGADPADPATLTFRQNFTGFWNVWRACGPVAGDQGIVKRDYAMLDTVYPGRLRSAEEFFRRRDEEARASGFEGGLYEALREGKMGTVLKLSEDVAAMMKEKAGAAAAGSRSG